jgi:hypothetical protein
LAEVIVSVGIDEAYAKLKAQLTQSKCRIVAEKAPESVSVVQGSLWGTSPKTAQKKTNYTLRQDASGTHVTSASALTAGYINLAVVGCVLSVALALVCAWIAFDLQAYVSIGVQGFWSWLAQAHGRLNADAASLFIGLAWILVAFLAATLVAEAVIVVRVRAKKDLFAEETLKTLQP